MPSEILPNASAPAEMFVRVLELSQWPNECINWPFYKARGYAMVSWDGKDKRAARLIFSLLYSELPDFLHVLHRCDNPACINPDHLFLGTHRDNMDDRVSKGRTARHYGQENGRFRVTDELAKKMETLRLAGVGVREISKQTGVSVTQTRRILAGRRSDAIRTAS